MVTVGSAMGATIPTTFGQTKCNVLIDTGAMKSCMSQAYYQQLMLPATRTLHSCNIKSANGTNLCPIGIIEGEFKIGTKEYKNDFIVCKNLVRPCILGADFLRKHSIWTGWSPTGKVQLISQQKFLVESLEVLMKGPMIHNKQGIEIPGRNLAVVSVFLDTKTLQENQVYEVKPNLLLTNEHPNLIVLPMLHLVQKEKYENIPMALINLNEDEKIFLKRGEILGCLEPSSIEMNELIQEKYDDIGEEGERENESIPLEKKFITSPAEVNTHRKMQLQDAEVTKENREKFRLLCEEFEDIFSKSSSDIGKTALITMDIDTGDSPPVCQRPYNLPLKHREWVQKELETLEQAGVIVRSISPWASPIVVVPKKTEPGEPPRRRLCVDYRVINILLPEVQKAHSKAKGILTLVPLPQIKLEEQFRRANETQEYQAEAMQDMAQVNFQMKYDHMFAGVPMYDGTDPDTFDDWLYQIESLCELSRRNVRVELMGRASAQVKRIIRSLPLDIDWEIARRELKRCLTEEKSRAHFAFKLAQIKQKPNENLRIFILRYQDLHSAATGKTAAEDTDPTHIIRFLGMMTNSEIARKITQKGIPEGMTLGQAFTRAIELEAGYQLSEGVSLARPPEIMQVQGIEEVDEVAAMQNRFKDVVCWGCGEKGHLYRDCPHRRESVQDGEYDDSNEYAGKSEQVIRITQPITVATRDNIYKNMATQRTRANLYKAGYKRTKAALQKQQKINAAMSTTLAAQNPTMAAQTITTTTPKVVQPKTVRTQVIQNPNTTTQVVQVPTTTGTPGVGNGPNQTGQVKFIRVPTGTTRATYNLRPTPSTKVAPVTTTATAMATPVAAGRIGVGPQGIQVKQEPSPQET